MLFRQFLKWKNVIWHNINAKNQGYDNRSLRHWGVGGVSWGISTIPSFSRWGMKHGQVTGHVTSDKPQTSDDLGSLNPRVRVHSIPSFLEPSAVSVSGWHMRVKQPTLSHLCIPPGPWLSYSMRRFFQWIIYRPIHPCKQETFLKLIL